jgi:hypothetical protein
MRDGMIASLLVVAILVGGGAGYLIGNTNGRNSTSTIAAECTINAEDFLIMKVLNSSNDKPIGSLPVHVEAQYPACPPYPPYNEDLGTYNTNASGILSISATSNWFYLSINHGNEIYSVNATLGPGAVTCITFPIPYGNPNISPYCDPSKYFAS